MSTENDFNKPPDLKTAKDSGLVGLDSLKKVLERDFFAEATIAVINPTEDQAELVIHLNCNFGLTESLFHLNNGNWGGFYEGLEGGEKTPAFQSNLLSIEQDNNILVSIKELSLHLNDTSIVIMQLPNLSIDDNLAYILATISSNFVHFTKGLSQMPYEIFIPIHEEKNFRVSSQEYNEDGSYLKFWGLYFDGDEESSIYDVKNRIIIEHNGFSLLNQWD